MTAWKFGNYDLSSFGALTLIDDHLDIADRRGGNVTLPFRHGSIFVAKYFDERSLMFGLTISGQTIAEMEGIVETLKALAVLRTQQTLYKILQDGTIQTVPATLDRAFQSNRPAPHVVKLSLEFSLTQPYFRLSTAIADNTTTINASPKSMVVTNPGNFEETEPTIVLTGPLQNTVITNPNGCVLTYTGTIASPRVVTLSVDSTTKEWVATTDLGANVIGNITHSGAAELMRFDPGQTTLSITDATATTGTVKVSFNAPYI